MARGNRRRRALLGRILPTAVVGLLTVILVVGASVSPGYPAADLDLHDGSVWVTNRKERLLGKLNKQINDLETSVLMVNKDFDVLQHEKNVLVVDSTTNLLQRVDPATTTLGTPVSLSANAEVTLGKDTVAVVDETSGRMWARPVEQAMSIEYAKAKADWEIGRGGVAAVSDDGVPVAVSVTDSELVREVDGEPTGTPLPFDLAADADVQVAVVGETAIVLDRTGNRIWVEGSKEAITDERLANAMLQDSSATTVRTADADFAGVVATPTGMLGVTEKELVDLTSQVGGTPIQPVVVNGCAYGAFAAGPSGRVATVCSHAEAQVTPIPSFSGGELVFRVNRDVVVLNDEISGNVWMVTDAMQLVRDWQKVTPPTPEEGESTENDETVTRVDPKRTEENRKPTAVDDTFGVRAGRSTTIPVIENDSDPDGDILTVIGPPEISQGTLELVRGGTGLQVTLPPEATGSITFRYTIDDGRKGRDSATVRLNIRADDQQVDNQPPQMKRNVEPLQVTLGSTAQRRVLLDWMDPDGDDLVLVEATAPGDDEVTFTPDGMLTYTDVGTTEGRKVIDVVVSDGVSETAGQLVVSATKKGNIPPLANGDYYQVSVGEQLLAKPLANDVGNELALVAVAAETPGAKVVPNYDDNTFSFSAAKPGTYYVGYIVSNGPKAFGIVRVDVVEADKKNRPPVATRDVALLPAGGSVLVDPLANDEDLDNDVLVLQNISTHPDLKVRMIQRKLVEISAVNTPSGPVSLNYTVSDGQESSTGTLVVVPAPPVQHSAPVAKSDEVTVRAGDTASVRVMGNDQSPAGLKLTLDDELPEEPGAGKAWVDGEYVRFAAPKQDGEYRLVYQIRDERDQTASAQVRIFVVGDDVPNTPPAPRQVEGRVLAGTTGKILVPLDGIDPEGDAVRLIGVDSGPKLGRVTAVDEKWLEYEAYPESGGTDTFSYAVTDSRGAKSVGQVRVGVVPRSAVNSPPTTVDDPVAARPGRTVQVPALGNDTDPDGDAFYYTDKDPLQFDGIDDAEVVDRDVQFTVPLKPGNYLGAYDVVDARGAEATGYVLIESDPTAPLMAPVARDDQVSSAMVANKQVIEVPVLDNDVDPDGPNSELRVSVPEYDAEEGTAASVVGDNVRVIVGERMQQVRYEITDADGMTSSAVITVPGNADAVPALKDDITPQKVVAGETLTLAVNDFVVGTRGRKVILTGENRIWASNGEATANAKNELAFVAPESYVGPASVTFEVTDGSSTDDESGRRAVVSIPIEVLPPPEPQKDEDEKDPDEVNRPPSGEPMTLTIGAGEGPKSLDVSRGVTDPDGDELEFTKLTGETATGTKVTVNGSTITAEAELTVAPGTTMKWRGKATDGKGGEADVLVTINVTASSKPSPRAADDSLGEVKQGETQQVPVLSNDFNPFESEGKALRVIGANTESGSVNVSFTDTGVSVTPGESFVGEAVVRYQIEDATGTAERRAEGRIFLTVVGKPDKPGVPRVLEVGDRRAALQWTAPAANGKDITQYKVRGTSAAGGSVEQQCPSNSCTITGLTNDVEYRFTVVATNEVGDSEPSGQSAAVRPDVRPETPAAPKVKWGDKQVAVSWTPPVNNGSALTQYVLEMRGPNGIEPRTLGPGTTTMTWDGLSNGSAYAFRLQAHNKAPEPSNFSAWSATAIPAGKPGAPTAVEVSPGSSSDAWGTTATVSWAEVTGKAANGDAVNKYTVYRNGTAVHTAGAGTTSFTDSGLKIGTKYTYTVAATNKAGQGAKSKSTAPFTPYAAPTGVKPPRSKAGDSKVTVTYEAAQPNGAPVSRYVVTLSNGSKREVSGSGGGSVTFGDLDNGNNYSAKLTACSKSLCATSKSGNSVKPYGPPGAPNIAAKGNGREITVRATIGNRSNGAAIARLDISGPAQSSDTKPNFDTTVTMTGEYGKTYHFTAAATNEHNQGGKVAKDSVTLDKPRIEASWGKHRNVKDCTTEHCQELVVTSYNLNKDATCKISDNYTGNTWSGHYLLKAGESSGNTSGRTYIYGYPNHKVTIDCGTDGQYKLSDEITK
ncbi:Ig-like domain-containing protein [Enemella sp. A6]|uniref:Ig-like domain-containing protein n=1 Tax=Enemella sp. A6 TaxID=3440152 RepID=UPI003EBE9654